MRIKRTFFFCTWLTGFIVIGLLVLLQPFTVEGATSLSPPNSCQFLYIDANVGGSSGGHCALRIDNSVYHFQYFPDRIFRLVRDQWSYFRYIYNDLENRSIHAAELQLRPDDLLKIKIHCDSFLLVQSAHLERLAALTEEMKFLNNQRGRHRQIAVTGAGLFSFTAPPDEISLKLKKLIINAHGQNYLKEKLKALDLVLAARTPAIPRLAEDCKISSRIYPQNLPTLTGFYRQNRQQHTALEILENSISIDHTSLISPDNEKRQLTENERRKLMQYADLLATSIMQLPSSNRPDWGYPLILANARLQAVKLSLGENRLLLLDPFSEPAVQSVNSKYETEEDRSVKGKLADRALRTYQKVRKKVFGVAHLTERDYNLLENSAGRMLELEKGYLKGRTIRIAYGQLLPSRMARVELPLPAVNPENLKEMQAAARFNQKLYHQKLKQLYPYNLVTRNCATELIRTLNGTFKHQDDLIRGLGGWIDPDCGLSFIPFTLFDLVNKKFLVAYVKTLPGFRKRILKRMKHSETRSPVLYLRECNTLTSTIYHPVADDTPFIFFTDDVFLMRPIYGISNTVYGLLSTAAGIFTLPFDRGRHSLKGLKGVIYSLPEIFFGNIRKGSFDYVDDRSDPETKNLEKSAPAFKRQVSP